MAFQPLTSQLLRFEHHVARYCRPRTIVHDSVSRDAFVLRPGEAFLSTNWLEHFNESNREIQISGVRAALSGKGFSISPNGRFAVLNVGTSSHRVLHFLKVALRFHVLGQLQDPSHTGVFGYGSAGSGYGGHDVAQHLARSIQNIYSAD